MSRRPASLYHDGGDLATAETGEGNDKGHDSRSDVVVHCLGDDPIHHGMPRGWKTPTLEIYYYARGPAKNTRVLSHGYDKHSGMNWPLEWTVRFGRGRIYSSTFGHVWKGDVQPPVCVAPENKRFY